MNRTNDDVTFPRFLTITDVAFGADGFRGPGSESKLIRWSDVEQVALIYEIHPIAIADWDCVAFRLSGEQLSVWVALEKNESFIAEVERRFAPLAAPAMKDWVDEPRCIRTYSVWPGDRLGEPLYVSRRIHWWSWEKSLAFEKRANQPLQPTAPSGRG
jgi:hypothetical protein